MQMLSSTGLIMRIYALQPVQKYASSAGERLKGDCAAVQVGDVAGGTFFFLILETSPRSTALSMTAFSFHASFSRASFARDSAAMPCILSTA